VFLRYDYVSLADHINPTNLYIYQITDSEFGDRDILVKGQAVESAVIALYKELKLPVLPNLIRCVLFAIKTTDLDDWAQYKSINREEIEPYLTDIERYIILL
jgi:hypothetical protein